MFTKRQSQNGKLLKARRDSFRDKGEGLESAVWFLGERRRERISRGMSKPPSRS